jgi:hypothetical protein
MKRSFRVASTLTGAAAGAVACAAAFTPAATAATTAAATTTQAARPAGVSASCAGRPNWVHLYLVWDLACVGFTGSTTPINASVISGWCGGNNYGSIFGLSKYNAFRAYRFHQGTTIAHFYSLTSGALWVPTVYISGWAGNETCPSRV